MKKSKRISKPKSPNLFLLLKEFENSIITWYLSARENLIVVFSLSKYWNRLLRKHYAWSRLPRPGPSTLLSFYIRFFDSFTEFGCVSVFEFPGTFLTASRVKVIETANEVSISHFDLRHHRSLHIQTPTILPKL